MTLEKLLTRMNYTLVQGSTKVEITDVVYDSRKVIPGCVFVCLIGSAVDSHKFAQDAADAGAAAVVISRDVTVTGAAVIKTDDTRKALAFLSAEYKRF